MRRGNVASVRKAVRAAYDRPAFAGVLRPPAGTWKFATAEETAEWLRTAGFCEVEAWTADRPVTPADPRAFLRTVILGPHLERIPEELHASFVDAVLEQLGDPPVLDYVRLNIAARRPRAPTSPSSTARGDLVSWHENYHRRRRPDRRAQAAEG